MPPQDIRAALDGEFRARSGEVLVSDGMGVRVEGGGQGCLGFGDAFPAAAAQPEFAGEVAHARSVLVMLLSCSP